MLQYYHDRSSNMDTPGKQYDVTTFLGPPPPPPPSLLPLNQPCNILI